LWICPKCVSNFNRTKSAINMDKVVLPC
jgi:hypothetical protein